MKNEQTLAQLRALHSQLQAALLQVGALIIQESGAPSAEEVQRCPGCGKAWVNEGPDYVDAGYTRVCAGCNKNVPIEEVTT